MNTLQNITHQLQELQIGKPWIGSTYQKKLDLPNESDYFERPTEGMHSVAEIISHLTLWRTEAILKVKTGKGSKTDSCPENWINNDELQQVGWESIKSAYDETLTELIALLEPKTNDFLAEQYFDTDFNGYYTYEWLLNGMVQHDAYHLGQIGIIVKFLNMNK
ncbi:MAG: DinB family protein [Crocinitomicaceae bacterium]